MFSFFYLINYNYLIWFWQKHSFCILLTCNPFTWLILVDCRCNCFWHCNPSVLDLICIYCYLIVLIALKMNKYRHVLINHPDVVFHFLTVESNCWSTPQSDVSSTSPPIYAVSPPSTVVWSVCAECGSKFEPSHGLNHFGFLFVQSEVMSLRFLGSVFHERIWNKGQKSWGEKRRLCLKKILLRFPLCQYFIRSAPYR